MKKVSIFLYFFSFANLYAQLPTVQQYRTQQATAWQTSLSTLTASGNYTTDLGLLYDKVTPFSGLHSFNEADNNGSSASHFKQALSELYYASNMTKFTPIANLNNLQTLNQSAQIAIPLPIITTPIVKMGIINTYMSYLNYNPEFPNNGGVKLINGIYVPANNLTPFIRKQITIASPLEETVCTSNKKVTYKFNTADFYQYGTKKIASLTANFGNGLISSLMQNQQWLTQTITVTYTAVDEIKLLTFNITYTDGTTLTTYSYLTIKSIISNEGIAQRGTSPLEKYWSTIADSNGALGKLEYRIFYGDQNTNNILKKPFIIVDGFDPGDKRRVIEDDCANDPDCIKINEDWGTKTYESIAFLMKYNNQASDLKDILTALNYDVIIVNFPNYENNFGQKIDGGADDIFRNGRTIASFIQNINNQLLNNGSTEKLVLVGPSMGGQITRYALSYMEKKQQETNNNIWKHNTRLWLSMDSPHQGATIPLATQGDLYFLGELLGKDDAKKKYNDVIKSKAARQMLLTIAGPQANFYNAEHNVYKQELISSGVANSNGYPVLNGIRKIAISNGSLSGIKNVNPSQKFYEVVALAKLRSILTLGIRIAKIPVFRLNNWFMPEKNTTSSLLRNYSKEPAGELPWDLTNNLPFGSLDALPGGSFNAANDLKDVVYKTLKGTNAFGAVYYAFPLLWTGSRLIVEQRIPNDINTVIAPQAFIPTHSALDTSGFNDWYQPINKNLVCSSQTPFDSYYGESSNQAHITFTDNMVTWLLKELANNPQAPSFPLDQTALSGPNIICENTNATYSFPDICKTPSPAIWTITANAQIISQTGYSVIVKGLTNGSATLTATFQNGQTVTKNIWVGLPTFNFSRGTYQSETCDGIKYHYVPFIINLPPDTSLTFHFLYPNIRYTAIGNVYTFEFLKNYSGSFNIYATATNICGTFYYESEGEHQIGNCASLNNSGGNKSESNNVSSLFKTYPNPTNNIINIELKNSDQKPANNSSIFAELYNMMGEVKRNVTVNNNIATVDVLGLPRGIYILKINIDGIIESHQVAIE